MASYAHPDSISMAGEDDPYFVTGYARGAIERAREALSAGDIETATDAIDTAYSILEAFKSGLDVRNNAAEARCNNPRHHEPPF